MTKNAKNSLNIFTAVSFIADSPGPKMYQGDPCDGLLTFTIRKIKQMVDMMMRINK